MYTRTIKMSYDNFESAVLSWLYAIGELKDSDNVESTDFGIEVDADGMVVFDIELQDDGKPAKAVVSNIPNQREFNFA